jgi:hypothetical protein
MGAPATDTDFGARARCTCHQTPAAVIMRPTMIATNGPAFIFATLIQGAIRPTSRYSRQQLYAFGSDEANTARRVGEPFHGRPSSRHCNLWTSRAQSRLLYARTRATSRQTDGELRRSGHLSSLLRRRGRTSGDDPDVFPVGICASRAGRDRPSGANQVPCTSQWAGILDASLPRTRRCPRATDQAVRRNHPALRGSRRSPLGAGRCCGRRGGTGLEHRRHPARVQSADFTVRC